jgi:Na+/melibiose symporter-like transporter
VAPFVAVVVAQIWIKEPERFRRIKEIRQACDTGDEENANQLSEKYDIPLEHARTFRFRELFTADLRKQTSLLAFSFFCFGACVVATNVYIVYWLTHFNGFSNRGAVYLMLGCAFIGFWFYVSAGWMGEFISRRKIMFVTAALVPVFTFIFMWVHGLVWTAIVYFFVYQVTNGTWSGAGYTYVAESFPTPLRGTGAGFIDACTVSGFVFAAAVWTGLIQHVSPRLVWGIDAVLFSCGEMVIWFAKDFDPKQSLI